MTTQLPTAAPQAAWQPMVVKAAGLCCAVGYQLAAASCAMRAGIAHFQESDFVDKADNALVVASLPLESASGTARLARMAQLALADCAQMSGYLDTENTALMLLAAERGRPHTEPERYHACFQAVQELFSQPFHASSLIIPQGRAGIGEALLRANQLLQDGIVSRVLLLGVDSYLNAASINYYLQNKRLLTRESAMGFIPGEAAAAILLELAHEQSSGLHISGVGIGREEARPDNDTPNRAIGLTQAMREACSKANIAPSEIDFRLSDQNGEQFFSKEAANASTRFMAEEEESRLLPILTIADTVGEVGAAAGCVMLAHLSLLMARKDGPGFTGLAHLANDDGRRCALLLEQFA